MGFMAGFAKGFGDSLTATKERHAAEDADYTKMAFTGYMQTLAEKKAAETKETAKVAKAKALAKDAGMDPGDWQHAYDLLGTDLPETTILKQLQTATFSDTPKPDTTDAAQTVDPMTQQTQDSGMTEKPASQPAPDASTGDTAAQGKDQGLLGALSGLMKPYDPMQAANDRVSQAVGKDTYESTMHPAPVDNGMPIHTMTLADPANTGGLAMFGIDLKKGVTPKQLNGIKAQAAIWAQSDDPEDQKKAALWQQVQPMVEAAAGSVDENGEPIIPLADMEKIINMVDKVDNSPDTIQLKKDRALTKSTLEQMYAIDQIASKTGAVLTTVGAAASGWESLKKEVGTGIDVFRQMMGSGTQYDSATKFVEEFMSKVPGDQVTGPIGEETKKFQAKVAYLLFDVAAAKGQTGTSQSNKDLDRLINVIMSSNSYPEFSQNLRDIAVSMKDRVNTEIGEVQKGPTAAALLSDKRTKDFLGGLFDPMETMFADNADIVNWMVEKPTAGTLDTALPTDQTTTKQGDPTVAPATPTTSVVTPEAGVITDDMIARSNGALTKDDKGLPYRKSKGGIEILDQNMSGR